VDVCRQVLLLLVCVSECVWIQEKKRINTEILYIDQFIGISSFRLLSSKRVTYF
jgi:hypothetical protein